ncbi:hypothetical protein PXD56_06620 [Maribacter sp. SA7]|uniref:hypothetical protein n=1 Tax=Maribacter zhoushanensis TaxID=3030012 RepID=UPI0023ED5339|nr:hypothetical protein [Maribacter zhoushanensis]MDF4202618.1 hypothetical protein [Maribacter zhoushanensis]
MLKKLSEIPGVWRFIDKAPNGAIYFISPEKELCQFSDSEFKIIKNGIKCEIAEPWSGGYVINEQLFFNTKNVKPLLDTNIYKKQIIDNDSLVVKKIDFEKEEIIYGVFRKSQRNIEWIELANKKHIQLFVNNDCIISTSEDMIYGDTSNGDSIWNHSLSNLLDIYNSSLTNNFILIRDKLMIQVYDGKQGSLFIIDLNSGKIHKVLDGFRRFVYQDGENIFTTRFENILCKLNIESFEFENWDVNELIKGNGFNSIHDHRSLCFQDMFYFTETLGDTKAKFGVLDIVNKKLLFKYDFRPENGGISTIQKVGNTIYICTKDNTLHIFENNEMATMYKKT